MNKIDEQRDGPGFRDGALDDGLRAAFGDSSANPTMTGVVIDQLQETMGVSARVRLRSAGDSLARRDAPANSGAAQRYEMHDELARGGVGVVFRGRDRDLGRDVAVKMLRDDFRKSPGMVQRFVEEAQITGQLQHPGILPVYELGLRNNDEVFFTMKLIEGDTLAAWLKQRPSPNENRAHFITIFEQVCQTMAYAHARGVIHRDLKPSNIMVGAFGEVQVVDWGLAKVLDADDDSDAGASTILSGTEVPRAERLAPSDSDLSEPGAVMGTPAYMPPEQARGDAKNIDERADVFALGAILCEILTGSAPFAGTRDSALHAAQAGDLSEARERLESCESDLELTALAQRCLAADPATRLRDAAVVAEEVAHYRASLSARAHDAELGEARANARAASERKSRRLTLLLAVVVVAGLMCSAAAFYLVQQSESERRAQASQQLNQMIDDASVMLGQAAAAQIGDEAPWQQLSATTARIEAARDNADLNEESRERAAAFLERVRIAARDRAMVEKIEEIVIMGATHTDKQSWLWMEKTLREAFRNYGIDLDKLSPRETAERIRASDLTPQLTDGLELWIGTLGHLMSLGEMLRPFPEVMKWVDALYEADPDPFAASVRKLVYARAPSRDEVVKLMESIEFSEVRPRTLAWLASAAFRTNDRELVNDIFRRAVLEYPDDFMLNFDYAYHLTPLGEWEKAIRYYERCLAIRPNSAGIWRSLGVALRNIKDYPASIDALQRSLKFQPDHAWTYIDLGLTHEANEDLAAAREAYESALKLQADFEPALEALKRISD